MKNPLHLEKDSLTFNWIKTSWMYLFIIPSIIFVWDAANLKLGIISFCLTFFIVGIGHSIGLHRGIIHKSYKTTRIFRNIMSYLFVMTGLGSPLAWLKLHYIRDYWQNREDSPQYFQYHHSILKDYWWYLHLTYTPGDLSRYDIPAEDLNDPWLNWLDKTWYIHVLGTCALVWYFMGFDALIILMTLRISLTMLGHWFIGYITHKYGYTNYEISQADVSGTNTWFLGLISFGEGFHNNHHAHPNSAKFGLRWYEIDLSWYIIKVFKVSGLVWQVKEAGKDDTLKKRANVHYLKWSFPWLNRKEDTK